MTGWKKLLILVSALAIISMIILVSGCDLLTESDQGIIVTRYQDVAGGVKPPTVTSFGPGDLPVVLVYGYGGQTVTVRVYDTSTGQAVQGANQETHSIPEGMNSTWKFPDLPSGSYKATLSVGGIQKHATNFWVSR